MANIYFRRFLLAWEKCGFASKFCSRIVNYADDFVILCRERAQDALQGARNLIAKLGLTLNEDKTRVCHAGETPFNFLGYTFETLYRFGGGRTWACGRRIKARRSTGKPSVNRPLQIRPARKPKRGLTQ